MRGHKRKPARTDTERQDALLLATRLLVAWIREHHPELSNADDAKDSSEEESRPMR